jgi:nucleoside-diphosphate-sugar epimerase
MQNLLVTGAGGFVGLALCPVLEQAGYRVRRALRSPSADAAAHDVVVGDIGPATAWDEALHGIDTVIHLAARAHVMRDATADPLAEYRRVNTLGTLALAQAAGRASVRRLIFVSSIKVNGEMTTQRAFNEADAPQPVDPYGVSKWEAEQALCSAASCSGLATVILRPPLLYGAGVKGNFLTLLDAIACGVPLPFAMIDNRRSLLCVNNLVDAITCCINHPAAAGNTYLLADDEDVSTPGLIRAVADALGRPARLLPCPTSLLKLAGLLSGKSNAVSRLLGSLQIDSRKIRHDIGWRPRHDLAHGLRLTAEWYYQRFNKQVQS